MEVKEFGCIVQIVPGRSGLVHVSELSLERIQDATKGPFKEGDLMDVKLLSVGDNGRLSLSRCASFKTWLMFKLKAK